MGERDGTSRITKICELFWRSIRKTEFVPHKLLLFQNSQILVASTFLLFVSRMIQLYIMLLKLYAVKSRSISMLLIDSKRLSTYWSENMTPTYRYAKFRFRSDLRAEQIQWWSHEITSPSVSSNHLFLMQPCAGGCITRSNNLCWWRRHQPHAESAITIMSGIAARGSMYHWFTQT